MKHPTFSNVSALSAHLQREGKGGLLIRYENCEGYDGMVLGIMLVFESGKTLFHLDLQWMSFGLDPYGDTLQESYVYQFESLEELLLYLAEKYGVEVHDIPVNYRIDPERYPDPVKDEAKRPLFEAAWQRFQTDFRKGVFLDQAQRLVYSSIDDS